MFLETQGTLFTSCALRQLILLVLAQVVALALPLVAVVAEVSRTPAEPVRDRAAEATLKVNKVHSVFLARLLPALNTQRSAFAAHELFGLEFLLLLLSANTVLLPAKVGLLAFEALIVGEFEHGPRLQIIVKIVIRVF